jgi:hypothetical protein
VPLLTIEIAGMVGIPTIISPNFRWKSGGGIIEIGIIGNFGFLQNFLRL